eukprot:30828-Pelagococcus_subviridis.AAC.5
MPDHILSSALRIDLVGFRRLDTSEKLSSNVLTTFERKSPTLICCEMQNPSSCSSFTRRPG